MERLLDRLERRFGRYAPDNITAVVVTLMGVAGVLELFRPGFTGALTLEPAMVRGGQLWRLASWLILPPSFSPIWLFFAVWWTWFCGSRLQSLMGSFRYALYWLTGWAVTTALAMALGLTTTNSAILMSLFLGFATYEPDFEILVLFVLPVRVKWLAWLDAAAIAWQVATASGWSRLLPLLAVANYLLFFGPTLLRALRGQARQSARRAAKAVSRDEAAPARRRCAKCGVTDDDRSVEFRVCTCEKCGRPTDFCLAHARDH